MIPRLPLVVLAVASLLLGLTGGLARLGWLTPPPGISAAHGPLMTVGFFSTLIGLENAVRSEGPGRWVYAMPFFSGLAALGAFVSVPASAVLGLAAALLFAAIQVRARKGWVALAAAACFVGAAVSQLVGQRFAAAVPLWTTFLVLVILDERLDEISVRSARAKSSWIVRAAVGALVASSIAVRWFPDVAARARGLATVAVVAWFVRHDAPSSRVEWRGLAGYETIAIFAGYAWLAFSGVLLVGFGFAEVGPTFDAIAHSVFLGMAFSMVFAHASRVFPKLTGIRLAFAPDLYLPLAFLHVGLATRVIGDLAGSSAARSGGGLLSVLGLVLFPIVMAVERRRQRVAHG